MRRLDLDVVRGVAILLAMGWHLGVDDTGIWLVDLLMWPSRTFGWAGVDLFFVLSGFLMGRIIFRERDKTGGFDSKRFLIRRAFKLWPVFYVFLIAQVIFGDEPWQSFFFQNFFHLQNYLGSAHAHLWSLAVEEHFYLALALFAPFTFRRNVAPRIMLVGLAVVVVVPLFLRLAGGLLGVTAIQLQTLSHFRVDGLAGGLLLALVAVAYPDMMGRMLKFRWVWLLLTLASVWFVVMFPKGEFVGSTIGFSVTLVGAASFMLVIYRAEWVARLSLLLKPVAWLGVYSYSLYLWHIAAARLTEKVIERVLPAMDSEAIQMVLNYAGAISVAVVMTRLIEWPALRLRDRLMAGRPAAEGVHA